MIKYKIQAYLRPNCSVKTPGRSPVNHPQWHQCSVKGFDWTDPSFHWWSQTWLIDSEWVLLWRYQIYRQYKKQDGVGLVDNGPSIDKIQYFVKKNCKKKLWHVTSYMWHVTCDMWRVRGVNILSKLQLSSSYCLGFMILWRFRGKGSLTHWINQLIARRFIEQPRLHRVC